MTLFCYSPNNTFARIYIPATSLEDAQNTNQDIIWNKIKKEKFGIEPNESHYYWDDDLEEQTERKKWFNDWMNPKSWSLEGPVAVDTHY